MAQIKEHRMRPLIDVLESQFERKPLVAAPECPQVRCRHSILDQQCTAETDTRHLQRRGRRALKPEARPGLDQAGPDACNEACDRYKPGHGPRLIVLSTTNSPSSGRRPARWSAGVKSCC